MKDVEYDSSRPLRRLEKGDKAIIKVNKFHPDLVSKKDRNKYKDVPNGVYEAIYIDDYKLECKQYPVLSGKYSFWGGNKWGCTDGICADEIKQK